MKTRTLLFRGLLFAAILGFVSGLWAAQGQVNAQDNRDTSLQLAARLRVDNAGVEVRRVNTAQFIAVKRASLVAAGDEIRTGATGRTVIIFGDRLFSAILEADSEMKITRYGRTSSGGYTIALDVRKGFAAFDITRQIDAQTQIIIALPTFTFQLLAGSARTRVESDRRSGLLVLADGRATYWANDPGAAATKLDIPPSYGVRLQPGETPRREDIVLTGTFPFLDSSLDGCPGTIQIINDVWFSVRLGADAAFPRIGGLENPATVQVMGVARSGEWYRVQYRGGYGWLRVNRLLQVVQSCPGLRVFPDGYGPEDTTLFDSLGDPVTLQGTFITPTPDLPR